MRVTLHVISGPSAGRQIRLRSGQVGRFGRTEWSDFAFPDDETLAEVHFMLRCDPTGPRLRDLQSATGTRINGEPVTEAEVRSGDEIAAGAMRFLVEVDGEGPTPATSSGLAVADDAVAADEFSMTAAEVCEGIALEDDGRTLLADGQTPQEFADLLAEHRLFRDAVRFRAAWLPRRESILWGCRCVRDFFGERLSAEDNAQLLVAERWTAEPTEDLRREAERLAEQDGYRTPAGWLAAAVFWSGESLGPPESEPVPPAEHLGATAIAAALMLTAAQAPPLEVEIVLRTFIGTVENLPAI